MKKRGRNIIKLWCKMFKKSYRSAKAYYAKLPHSQKEAFIEKLSRLIIKKNVTDKVKEKHAKVV